MADQTERLLLQVDAATELLRRHLSEGEQPLDRFERRATKMAQNVDRAIGDMGQRFGAFGELAQSAADRAQRSFEASFTQVQKLAATAIKGPTIDGRINLGADDIRAGAAAAQEQARSFQLIGEAAERAALKEGDASEATRLFITATNASRLEAERKAAALLAEAGALERVEIELRQSAEATELFVTKHQRLADAAAQEQKLALTAANAAAEQRGLAASAALLRGELDPMYAAQQRFDAELTRADALLEAKIITEREYAQAVEISRARLTAHAQAVAGSNSTSLVLTQSTGALRAAMQGASYQVQDTFTQLSMGANIFQVVAIQGGQLAGQFSSIEGKAGSFARFMIGPYGLAITAALLITGALTKDLDLFGDKLEDATNKLKEDAAASELTRRAKIRYGSSVEGVTAALKEQDETLKQTAASEWSAAERANLAAKAKRDQALATRQNTAAQLADALAQEQSALEAARAQQRYGKGEAAMVAAQLAAGRVDALQAKLAQANAAITDAERQLQVTRVDLAAEQAQTALDPIRSVTKLYDDRIAAVKRQQREEARLGKIIDANSYRQIEQLERQKKAAVETAQARQAASKRDANAGPLTTFQSPVAGGRVTGRFGESRPGHQHAGIDYAVPVGTPVRAPAAGVVDVAGQRQGYGNAIYINFGGGTSARFGHLSKFNVKPGDRVEAGDIIGLSGGAPGAEGSGRSTGAHLHYEVRSGGKAVNPLGGRFKTDGGATANTAARHAETTLRQAETARQKLIDSDTAYNDEERAARQKLLDATRRTAASEEQRDALLRESINAEADATEKKIANQFDAGDISLAQAQHLYSINEATRAQRLDNVKIAAAQRVITNRYETEQQSLDIRLGQLRLEQDLATTDHDRREIGRQILDLEQQLRRKKLEQVRDTSNDPVEVARASRDLAALPAVEAAEDEQQRRRSAGPMETYRQRLRDSVGDMDEALEGVEQRGFQSLEDGLADIISGTESVGGAFKKMASSIIADLARIAAQKIILSAIGGGGFFGLATGGSPGDLPGFAGGGTPGGLLRGPGTGKSDSILALLANGRGAIRVSNGEFIINEQATREYRPLIEAINARTLPRYATGGALSAQRIPSMSSLRSPQIPNIRGRAGRDRMQLDVKAQVEASPLLLATVEQTSFRTVSAAAEPIMAGSQARTMRALQRPSLPGAPG